MKYILTGNGINIQFSESKFLNSAIIRRAIVTTKSKQNPTNAYPYETLEYLEYLYKEFKPTVLGKNDQLMPMSYEKKSLNEFKKRYTGKENLRITEIGFEDYFLLHEVFCRKNGIVNPDRFTAQISLRRFFLDAIYFNGKLNQLWKTFPHDFVQYLNGFDEVFTTNYDSNVNSVFEGKVNHLHGSFQKLEYVYNRESFRNNLSDVKGHDLSYTDSTPYLFSTALSTYSGDLKLHSMETAGLSNSAIEKFVIGYSNNPEVREEIDSWLESDNQLTRNLGEAIKLKADDEMLKFDDDYPLINFKTIKGELVILGLSPHNDSHIFEIIRDNENIHKLVFYYWDEIDQNIVEKILPNKEIQFRSTIDFWENF